MTDGHFLLVCDDVPQDVVLTDPGIRVMDVVQVVRRLTGLSLWRGKILAAQVPAVILTCVSEEDAAAAVSALRDAGGPGRDKRAAGAGLPEALSTTAHGPETAHAYRKSPLPTENPQVGGLISAAYFFLPWFLTASIAAAAAAGSR